MTGQLQPPEGHVYEYIHGRRHLFKDHKWCDEHQQWQYQCPVKPRKDDDDGSK